MPSQLSHFAIHADDVARASKFYGGVFGWKFQGYGNGPMNEFCMIQDAAGNRLDPLGAIQLRKFNTAPQSMIGFECSFAVDDVEATARAVEAAGGKIVMQKSPIPSVGWVIKFLDTEGNLACAVQYDATGR